MTVTTLLEQVNPETLYKIITDLEGPKYPLDDMEALNRTCDYIVDQLTAYGIRTEIQSFQVDGIDETFKNIIGYIGDIEQGATLIGSHYDTVRNTPAANDNLSAVAVSLELARLLATLEAPPAVVFGFFTLEEGHPGIAKAIEDQLLAEGLLDNQFRPTSASFLKQRQVIFTERRKRIRKGMTPAESCSALKTECPELLTADGLRYIDILESVYTDFYCRYSDERLSFTTGSYEFVQKMKRESIPIRQIIVYDCLGWLKKESGVKKQLPLPWFLMPLTQKYRLNLAKSPNNYIGVIASKPSQQIYKAFLKSCRELDGELPYLGFKIPLEFAAIKKQFPDVLRSDHAPFWRENIPGLFVTDLANFRSDYYHTPADTSEHLNYDALMRITQATLKTLVELG